jgi:hypothetical protein
VIKNIYSKGGRMYDHFIFENFSPPQLAEQYANSVLSKLLDSSPSNSTSVAVIEQDELGFNGKVEINTEFGPFVANDYSNDLKDLVDRLQDQIQEEISVWRTRRFDIAKSHSN